MDAYILKITSAKGVPLDYLCKEIELIAHKYKDGHAKIQLVSALDCKWLRSDNLRLKTALQEDNDFIVNI